MDKSLEKKIIHSFFHKEFQDRLFYELTNNRRDVFIGKMCHNAHIYLKESCILQKCNKEIVVSCHSTIHEVYFVNFPDLWLRTIAGLCRKQGREMIVEMFLSGCGEDLYHCPSYPCPRLIYEQLESVSVLQGITGIKEYYGICQKYFGINEAVLRHCLTTDNPEFSSFIKEKAREYVQTDDLESIELLLYAWELSSHTLELIPWELSWVMRIGNYHPYDLSYYGKTGFYDLMRTPWDSPSWLSNRRSYYMVTRDDSIVNDTYSDDVIKRLEICFSYFEKICALLSKIPVKDSYKQQIERQIFSITALKLVLKCRYYHLLDTLISKHGGTYKRYDRAEIRDLDIQNARDMLEFASVPPEDVPVTFDLEILNNFMSTFDK